MCRLIGLSGSQDKVRRLFWQPALQSSATDFSRLRLRRGRLKQPFPQPKFLIKFQFRHIAEFQLRFKGLWEILLCMWTTPISCYYTTLLQSTQHALVSISCNENKTKLRRKNESMTGSRLKEERWRQVIVSQLTSWLNHSGGYWKSREPGTAQS